MITLKNNKSLKTVVVLPKNELVLDLSDGYEACKKALDVSMINYYDSLVEHNVIKKSTLQELLSFPRMTITKMKERLKQNDNS